MTKLYPFNEAEELKNVGEFKKLPGMPYNMPPFPTRKFNTPITPKENVLRIYRGEKPLWLPTIQNDINFIQPDVMADAHARNYGGTDWFGIEWEYEEQSAAAMVKPGTRRLSDLENWEEELIWPDLSAVDWAADYEKNYKDALDPDRATMFVIVNGCFERLADLTSFEDTFCYLLEEEELLEAFYNKLTDFHIELMRIAKEYYHADIITFHDDMGTQISSFMSPDTFQEVLMPHYQRMNKAAHEMGLFVNLHSCGCIANQIENIIESGFDSWEGQANCNDMETIMQEHGDRLAQCTMMVLDPAMTDDELLAYIDSVLNGVGSKGRLLCLFGDTNPNRSFNTLEELYKKSRIYYCGEEK